MRPSAHSPYNVPSALTNGEPAQVRYLYAMAAWSDGLQLTLTGSVRGTKP